MDRGHDDNKNCAYFRRRCAEGPASGDGEEGNSARTGDTVDMSLYILLMCVSGSLLLAILLLWRRAVAKTRCIARLKEKLLDDD